MIVLSPLRFLALFALAVPLRAQTPSLTPTFANVSYGSGPFETMDVYLPVAAEPTPVVVEIHGGGWSGGAKSLFAPYGMLLEKAFAAGIAVVSIDYPLAPASIDPAQNDACRHAVQFIRAHATEWNLDPQRIGAVGASAGGQLGLWVALAADAADPSSPDPILQQSSRIRCVIAYQAPLDFTDTVLTTDEAVAGGFAPMIWNYFGVASQLEYETLVSPEAKDAASPVQLAASAEAGIAASVGLLGIYEGNPTLTSSSQLVAPTGDLHNLLFGFLMKEALEAAGAPDPLVWVGGISFVLPQQLLAEDLAVDWLSLKLRDDAASVLSYGTGTPGCVATQMLSVGSLPKLGNALFELRSHNGPPTAMGFVVIGTAPSSGDPFGIGLNLLVDIMDLNQVIVLGMSSDANGRGASVIPIPDDPTLAGRTFYLQVLWPWDGVKCVPSPLDLSSTNGLKIVVHS